MKVKQLIDLLKQIDPETHVVQFADGNNGYVDVSNVSEVNLALNVRKTKWGSGPHIPDMNGTSCVVISR